MCETVKQTHKTRKYTSLWTCFSNRAIILFFFYNDDHWLTGFISLLRPFMLSISILSWISCWLLINYHLLEDLEIFISNKKQFSSTTSALMILIWSHTAFYIYQLWWQIKIHLHRTTKFVFWNEKKKKIKTTRQFVDFWMLVIIIFKWGSIICDPVPIQF